MKKIISAIVSLVMIAQMLMSVPVMADETVSGIGEAYTKPESPAVTYNMNLDWKFFETSAGWKNDIWTSMAEAEKNGVPFYAKDYDDSDWESVSIPHAINGEDAFTSHTSDNGGGPGRMGVFLYRKTFTVPEGAAGGKVFFELEGIRQAAYVWVNGNKVGYYEAGIAAMGFDITEYVTAGETAVIAICEDCTAGKGNPNRLMFETVPGEEWGSSYTPDNYKNIVGKGAGYVWNTRDFNETQAGLVYDAYLHVTGPVYQTLPLYNNLKTTGNYIYGSDFNIRENKAKINVKAEVRNETNADGNYTLSVDVVDHDGNLAYSFTGETVTVKAATDAGEKYETAVESDVYDEENIANSVGLTQVNTPDVTYINASYEAEGLHFWSLDNPYLYTVYTILKDSNGNVVDVQKKVTGFRKVTFDKSNGVMINDKSVWLTGYAQRSTNEWAVIGTATDWLNDYDMSLLKENNSNFIRWMHVAPKPATVRSSDRYGVAVVCPAGDKEGAGLSGRAWSQRTEAMRDVMIYFRNSPSVIFWETGNSSVGTAANANEMAALRDILDPYGMRFIGARSTTASDQLNYEYNYAGTMYGASDNNADAKSATRAMETNGILGPIMETEYAREESPRRVWDRYSPPDYDYVNKWLSSGSKKEDNYDVHDLTQEEITVKNVKEYNGYYSNRNGYGDSVFSAEAMMVWTDSNMHGRNSGTENCRTSGRVDPVRQTKEMFEGTRVAHSEESAVHIVGHWSYPELTDETYNYFASAQTGVTSGKSQKYKVYDTNTVLKRDPTNKTVYVIGSADVSKVEFYLVDGEEEKLLGTDEKADSTFVYQFDGIDITKGDGVIAKAYDARGTVIATDEIKRTYDAVSLRLTPHTAPVKTDDDGNQVDGWRADGSDIAYFDVEVIDKNGNVCALNYDKIDFTYSGEGEYLGGYNSGMGSACFQNTSESTGISKYFGGAKDGVSTIRKDYVYAENGTNRIFVKSTRNAGTFTLTASMDGIPGVSASITSVPVETVGGLTEVMSSTLEPGVSTEIPVSVAQMKPLMKNKFVVDWAKVNVEKEVDTRVYYTVKINDTELELGNGLRARLSTMDKIFGPVIPILDKLKDAGAPFTYTYDNTAVLHKLEFTANGHTYTVEEGTNAILTDGADPTEIIEIPKVENGTLFVSLSAVITYVPGVTVSQDDTNKVLNITYTAQ